MTLSLPNAEMIGLMLVSPGIVYCENHCGVQPEPVTNAKVNFLTPLAAEMAERLLFAKDISTYGANTSDDEEDDGDTGVDAGDGLGDGVWLTAAAFAVVTLIAELCPEVPAESRAATLKLYDVLPESPETV